MMQRGILFLFSIGLMTSCSQETGIPVKANFSLEIENNDYSVPVRIRIMNESEEADSYAWTFEGGSPASSTDKNPGTIQFDEPGDYVIKLEASNRDGNKDVKEVEFTSDAPIKVAFEPNILENNFSPMTVDFVNTTQGANSYTWTFEGGERSVSRQFQPKGIVFETPGEHKIILEASNGRTFKTAERTVTVAPYLVADFKIVPAFEDDDFQAPAVLNLENHSISATAYNWNLKGAEPNLTTLESPAITILEPGTYDLVLNASNGKRTNTLLKTVTVHPNTNLRVFEDVELGINSAHSSGTRGAFFSTITRETYTAERVNDIEGSSIDVVFFGLNPDFTFNKFISPEDAQDFTFAPIQNAQKTKFINLQEECECGASLSVEEFDAMENDSLLEALTIVETEGGIQDFDASIVPRIVLFETGEGRKGAIKIKEFVANGSDSYVVVDIKVQKE